MHISACVTQDLRAESSGGTGDQQALMEQGWGPEGPLGQVLVDRWTDGTIQTGGLGDLAQPAGALGERTACSEVDIQEWACGQ